MGTKAELEASNSGGSGMIVALPPNSIHSLSSSEVTKIFYNFYPYKNTQKQLDDTLILNTI